MNKRERWIDRLQNIGILLLSLSFITLLAQTPLFGNFSAASLSERFRFALSPLETAASEQETSPSAPTAPVRIVAANGFARFSMSARTTAEADFESAGTFLGEAIGSAYHGASVSESVFVAALKDSGLYFDFLSVMPTEVLGTRLGSTPAFASDTDIRRCLLSIENGEVFLFLQSSDGSYMRFSTVVSAALLEDYLNRQGDSVEFAAFSDERFASLSPFTLLPADTVDYPVLSAADMVDEQTPESIMRLAEFNAHTRERYTESNGTVVVLEAQRMLRIQPDGYILYSGSEAEEGSLFAVNPAAGETLRSAALFASQRLLCTLLSTGGDGVYLSRLEDTKDGFLICFDYMVNGTPVFFSDGSHAAEITVSGQSITDFSILARRYSVLEQASLLLPANLSAAIASHYSDRELQIVYVDSGADSVSADWVAVP